MSLKTDYKDYELAPNMGGKKRYRMINNDDGTVSFVDVSEYLEIGDTFKADDINTTNGGVNGIYEKGFASDNLLPFNSFERSIEGFLVESFPIHMPKGTYTLSANVEGDAGNGWAWIFSKNGVDIETFGGNYAEHMTTDTKTLPEDADSLRVYSNGRVKATNIMFNKGSEALPFQPYAKSNVELTEGINTILDSYNILQHGILTVVMSMKPNGNAYFGSVKSGYIGELTPISAKTYADDNWSEISLRLDYVSITYDNNVKSYLIACADPKCAGKVIYVTV